MAKPVLEKDLFEVDDDVEIINEKPLYGSTIAPPVKVGEKKKVEDIVLDADGNQHLDLGLVSKFSYISSYETGEHLPDGDKIHYCHPSRCKKL